MCPLRIKTFSFRSKSIVNTATVLNAIDRFSSSTSSYSSTMPPPKSATSSPSRGRHRARLNRSRDSFEAIVRDFTGETASPHQPSALGLRIGETAMPSASPGRTSSSRSDRDVADLSGESSAPVFDFESKSSVKCNQQQQQHPKIVVEYETAEGGRSVRSSAASAFAVDSDDSDSDAYAERLRFAEQRIATSESAMPSSSASPWTGSGGAVEHRRIASSTSLADFTGVHTSAAAAAATVAGGARAKCGSTWGRTVDDIVTAAATMESRIRPVGARSLRSPSKRSLQVHICSALCANRYILCAFVGYI